jgi:hypothetical protein
MKVGCPHCGRTMQIHGAYAGRVTSCPFCHGSFTAPRPYGRRIVRRRRQGLRLAAILAAVMVGFAILTIASVVRPQGPSKDSAGESAEAPRSSSVRAPRIGEVWAPTSESIVVLKRPRLARDQVDFLGLQETSLNEGQEFRIVGFGKGDGEDWLEVDCLQTLAPEFGGGERVYAHGWIRRKHLKHASRVRR